MAAVLCNDIVERANRILLGDNPSICMYPAVHSAGGIHDYYSQGTYWHPDPEKPDGQPYIKKDGILNRNNFVFHKNLLVDIKRDTSILYVAYNRTGCIRYICKIEDMINSFFIDENTRMNPSLCYSQAIPGICEGRSIGVIDFVQLVQIPLLMRELCRKNLIPNTVMDGFKAWCEAYSTWLMVSDFGKAEALEHNNHSITFYMQLAAFSIFRKDWPLIREEITKIFKERLMKQVDKDAWMPAELSRTKPYTYSMFALDCLVTLAILLDEKGEILIWKNSEGASLKMAIERIACYMVEKDQWPYEKDVENFDVLPLDSSFIYVYGKVFRNEDFLKLYEELPCSIDKGYQLERHVPIYIPQLLV